MNNNRKSIKKRKKQIKADILKNLRYINDALAGMGFERKLYLIRAGKKYKVIDDQDYLIAIFIRNGELFVNTDEGGKSLGLITKNIIEITNYIISNYDTLRKNRPYILMTSDLKWKVGSVSMKDGKVVFTFVPASKRIPLIIADKEYADNLLVSSDKSLIIKEFNYKVQQAVE